MFDFLESVATSIATGTTIKFLVWTGIIGSVFSTNLFGAFRNLIKARTLEDIPTSRARSAEQGYVELEGHAEMLDGEPIRARHSGRECVWWMYQLQKPDGDGDWKTVESETSDSLFALRDDTGICLIDPEGADVYPTHSKTWKGRPEDKHKHALMKTVRRRGLLSSSRDYRIREFYIYPHELICAIGMYRTHKAIDDWDDQTELRNLLAEWKRNQTTLLSRFDKDGDGVIDQDEWELARAAAIKELDAERKEHAVHPGVNVLGATNDRRPFLIAPLKNSDFAYKLRKKAIWHSVGMVATGFALIFILISRFA